MRIEDEKLLAEQGPKKWLARRVQRAIAVAEFNRGVRREMAGRVVAQRRQSRQRRPVSDRAPVRLVSVVPRSRERRSSSRVSRAGPRGADSDEPEPPSRWPWRIGDVEHDRALTFELGSGMSRKFRDLEHLAARAEAHGLAVEHLPYGRAVDCPFCSNAIIFKCEPLIGVSIHGRACFGCNAETHEIADRVDRRAQPQRIRHTWARSW